ncbi:MAG: hypothetical protein RPR28_06405 [Cycloclasticus sp.]
MSRKNKNRITVRSHSHYAGAINSFDFMAVLIQLCEGNASRAILLNNIILRQTWRPDEKDSSTGKRKTWGKIVDGRKWIWDIAKRQQRRVLPGHSEGTVNEHLKWLEKRGLIIRRTDLSREFFDCGSAPSKAHRKWISVDFVVLDRLLEQADMDYENGIDEVDNEVYVLARQEKRKSRLELNRQKNSKNDGDLEAEAEDLQVYEKQRPVVATGLEPTMTELSTGDDLQVYEKQTLQVYEKQRQSIKPLLSIKFLYTDNPDFPRIDPDNLPEHWLIFKNSLGRVKEGIFEDRLSRMEGGFDLFWAAYTESGGGPKPACKKAWDKSKNLPPMAELLDAVIFRSSLSKTLDYLKNNRLDRAVGADSFLPAKPFAAKYIKESYWEMDVYSLAPWLPPLLATCWSGLHADPNDSLGDSLDMADEDVPRLLAYVFTRMSQDLGMIHRRPARLDQARIDAWARHGVVGAQKCIFIDCLQKLVTDYRITFNYDTHQSALDKSFTVSLPSQDAGGVVSDQ